MIEDDSENEDEMSPHVTATPPAPPPAGGAAINQEPAGELPWPVNPFMEQPPFLQSLESSLPSAPLTGALAAEMHHMQASTNHYTAEELDDMPDMQSPSLSMEAQGMYTNESVSR